MIASSFKNYLKSRQFQLNFQRFSAVLIDGKGMSKQVQTEIKAKLGNLRKNGLKAPQLTVIQVGDNAASEVYIKNKLATAKYVGIHTNVIKHNENISENDLISCIKGLNTDTNVNGILVQLPLPNHIDERLICNIINPSKDVDGFHYANAGKMFYDLENSMKPCTALAVVEILKRSNIQTQSKTAIVCGRSKNVGLPIALLLQADSTKTKWGLDATVSICNRKTSRSQLENLCKLADIIVSATGVPNLITADIVKPGACVIDVGITRIQNKEGNIKLVGDVDFEGVSKVAGHITPVPGGVGPMTVAMLMQNLLNTVESC